MASQTSGVYEKQNSNECITISMLIFLILLDICVTGWSKTSVVYFATGNTATLICPLNTFGEHVTWRKDWIIINDANNKINPKLLNNEKYKVVSNETHRNILYIRMAEDDEVGEYHCVTTINNGIKIGFVQLLKKDIPNVSVIVTPNSTVYEGTHVIFQCIHDVKSTTVFKWFKHGNLIQNVKSNLEYYIDNITRFDAGVYGCSVVRNMQYGFGNVSLSVLYAPDVFVIDYNNGTLFCNASGNPDKYTYAQWEHSSSMNNHIRYINGTEDGHIHFTDLESQTWFYYSGIYTCFAENGVIRNAMLYQSGFQHIELKGIPQCLQNSITEHGIQGKSTILSFELYSSPKYTSYQWKTLTYTISNMSRKYETTVTGSYLKTVLYNDVPFQVAVWRFSLNIYNIDQEDFDIYTIQVANEIGYTSCSIRFKPMNVRDMKNMLYFGILTLSVILLFTSVICNICIHKHCKKLARVRLQTGNNEVSGVNIEMTNIINEYHTINEEDIRQEVNEVQNQAEIHNTYDSSSHDSDDKSDESVTNENELRESNDYLNPYCTMIQSTSDVHNYESLSLEKVELNTSIANVDLNTGIQRSYENLKF